MAFSEEKNIQDSVCEANRFLDNGLAEGQTFKVLAEGKVLSQWLFPKEKTYKVLRANASRFLVNGLPEGQTYKVLRAERAGS